jgi:pyroglutamyl-peptidase
MKVPSQPFPPASSGVLPLHAGSAGVSPRWLLTSFDIWQPHQRSNASDDLLELVLAEFEQRPLGGVGDRPAPQIHTLRKLPVDFDQAPAAVLAQVTALQPELIVCCGMAESRSALTVESNGKFQSDIRFTAIALPALVQSLRHTHISHDAGDFVCNHLYYRLLQHIAEQQLPSRGLFLHVPVLTAENQAKVVEDAIALLTRLS